MCTWSSSISLVLCCGMWELSNSSISICCVFCCGSCGMWHHVNLQLLNLHLLCLLVIVVECGPMLINVHLLNLQLSGFSGDCFRVCNLSTSSFSISFGCVVFWDACGKLATSSSSVSISVLLLVIYVVEASLAMVYFFCFGLAMGMLSSWSAPSQSLSLIGLFAHLSSLLHKNHMEEQALQFDDAEEDPASKH